MANLEVYRSVFNAHDDACLLINAGSIIDCNQQSLRLFGCPREEILGKSPHQFSPERQIDGSDSALLISQRIAAAFDSGRLDFPWQFLNCDGKDFSAKVSLIPFDSEGEQVLFAMIEAVSDESSEDTFAFHQVSKEQCRKLESLSLMAGGLAHDFNNFLLAIMGNADLLDRDLAAGKPGGELLNEIRKGAGRAADLCNQLLSYAGKGQSHFQLLDLSLTAQEMVQMIKVAISRKIALRLELAPDLPMIEGDVTQIHQLIMNLVVNSSEAIGNRAGVITLATGLTCCMDQHLDRCLLGEEVGSCQLVYIEVRDDGDGMDEATRKRIFDPFFSTKVRGRGLGLASVLGTVRSHQGSLCVRSDPGQGTVLRACIPVAKLDHADAPDIQGRRPARNGHGTILIVDDEEYLRLLCSRMLQRMGYTVLMAADGPQALDIFRQKKNRIDGVILDLVMPVMDGVEVLERILDMDASARVIMTSGYHEKEIATRFSGRRISGFIQKPYVMSDLAKVLGRVVKPRGEQDPAS